MFPKIPQLHTWSHSSRWPKTECQVPRAFPTHVMDVGQDHFTSVLLSEFMCWSTAIGPVWNHWTKLNNWHWPWFLFLSLFLWRTSSYSSCYYSSLFWNSTQTLTTDNCEIPVGKPERPTDILWVASLPAGLCYPGQLLTLSFLPIRLPILECAFTSSGVFKLPFGETQFYRNLNREAKIPAAAKGRHALIGRRGRW